MAAQTPKLQSYYFQAQFDVEIEESVWLSEEVVRPQYFEEIQESVQLSEEINVLYVGIDESVIFSEEVDLTVEYSRDIDETVLFSEQIELTTGFTPRLFSFYFKAKFEIAIEESVWFTEEVNPLFAAISESFYLSEETGSSPTSRIDETVLFSEEVVATFAKTPKLFSFWFFGTEVLTIETIYLSEDLEIWTDGVLTLPESIVFREAVERYREREISEGIVLSEVIEIQVVGLIVEEGLVFSEEMSPLEIVKVVEESVYFVEEVSQSQADIQETFELEESVVRQFLPSPIEEQVFLSEELEVRQTISETIFFSEGVYQNQVGPIPETVYLQEFINLDIPQSIFDQLYLQEEVKLQIVRICDEQIVLSESLEAAYGIFESIFLSEEIYQSRLSLDETFNLTEQVQRGVPVSLSESIYFEEEVVRQVEISETVVLREELWNNLRLIDEEIVFSEVLLKEVHIWIGPGANQVDLYEDFVLSEAISFTKVEAISEQILFSEEVESIFKEGVPEPSPFVRKAVAEPKPVEAVSYPVAKAPPVVKRAYPSAKPVPLAKRVPPLAAPEARLEAPPPPEVRVERKKTRVVRMKIADNSSRYQVK